MAEIREEPVRYVAPTDGRKFQTKEAAERHEALTIARNAFTTARHRLGQVMAENQRTADGFLFDFGVFRDYYHVAHPYGGWPFLTTVSFLGFGFDWSDNDGFRLIQPGGNDGRGRQVWNLSELYAKRENAQRALLTYQVRRLEELREITRKHAESLRLPGPVDVLTFARPRAEWHEEDGVVLWWWFPIQEAPHCGSPLDDDFPAHVTHWTPLPYPAQAAVQTETEELTRTGMFGVVGGRLVNLSPAGTALGPFSGPSARDGGTRAVFGEEPQASPGRITITCECGGERDPQSGVCDRPGCTKWGE